MGNLPGSGHFSLTFSLGSRGWFVQAQGGGLQPACLRIDWTRRVSTAFTAKSAFRALATWAFLLLLQTASFQPAMAIDIDNQDGLPDFSGQTAESSSSSVNPLGAPGQILFQADMGFVPTSGPTVTGAIGNSGLGTGFLVGLEGGYTIYPNLALTIGISIHAFGNDTNIPLLVGAQYFFANGGGFPVTVGNSPLTLVPYLEFAFGPSFNSSTASNGEGVGAMGFAFRVGPGLMVPFGTVRHQGIFFEIDYENQTGPFAGSGISSSSFSLVPVKIGYITLF